MQYEDGVVEKQLDVKRIEPEGGFLPPIVGGYCATITAIQSESVVHKVSISLQYIVSIKSVNI